MFKISRRFNASNSGYTVRRLKNLSPDGREMSPQCVYIAKGKWHQATRINEDSFSTEESLSMTESGIILFPATDQPGQRNKVTAYLRTALNAKTNTFSIGNIFTGIYPAESGVEYNEQSLSVTISNISSKKLMDIAADLAAEFKLHSLLVKDLKENKFYTITKEIKENTKNCKA